MHYLGIDPGAHGGYAVLDRDGSVILVAPLPATDRDLLDVFMVAGEVHGDVLAVLEHVWAQPAMGASGAFHYGVTVGTIRMALVAAQVRFDQVAPQRWQKALGVIYRKGATQTERKNSAKARAEQLFPGCTITHATADALLIAEYCRRLQTGVFSGQEARTRQGNAQSPKGPQGQETSRPAAPAAPPARRRAARPRGHGAGPAHAAR